MKTLDERALHGVIRELSEAPHLVRWFFESRIESREQLEGASLVDEMRRLQGECRALSQILDKLPEDNDLLQALRDR